MEAKAKCSTCGIVFSLLVHLVSGILINYTDSQQWNHVWSKRINDFMCSKSQIRVRPADYMWLLMQGGTQQDKWLAPSVLISHAGFLFLGNELSIKSSFLRSLGSWIWTTWEGVALKYLKRFVQQNSLCWKSHICPVVWKTTDINAKLYV